MNRVRNAIVTVAMTAVTTLFVTASAVPETPSSLGRPALRDRLPHPLGDLVLALEEPERAAARGQVLDVARDGVDEVVHLGDDDRDDRGAECGDREDRADEDDRDREPAPARRRAAATPRPPG